MNHDYDDRYDNRKAWRKERKRIQEKDRTTEKKQAPIDTSLKRGRVLSIAGDGFWVDCEGERVFASLKGQLKKQRLSTKSVLAVGDFVRLTSDLSIAQIEERYSSLARTGIRGTKEQLIAANVDQAIIVVSVVNPPLKPALVDRYLIAAEKGNIRPIIVINKIDLLKEKSLYNEFVLTYETLGFTILAISTKEGLGLDALRAALKDKVSVFAGQSGVGKSSILNACYGLSLKTGELAQKTSKGTHTTTTAELMPLPDGGYCVDTPGVRSFGLRQLEPEDVTQHFFEYLNQGCKYPDCKHISEPHCAVLKLLAEDKISLLRYESYQTLLDEAMGGADNWTKRKSDDN